MPQKFLVLTALTMAAVLSACGGSDTRTEEPVETGGGIVYVGPTVLTKTDLVVGTGLEAVVGKYVSVYVTRWTYLGTAPEFKGEKMSGPSSTPDTFLLIASDDRLSIGNSVVGMKVGGKRTALFPGDLAPRSAAKAVSAGTASLSAIPPPREPYVAEIELVAVN